MSNSTSRAVYAGGNAHSARNYWAKIRFGLNKIYESLLRNCGKFQFSLIRFIIFSLSSCYPHSKMEIIYWFSVFFRVSGYTVRFNMKQYLDLIQTSASLRYDIHLFITHYNNEFLLEKIIVYWVSTLWSG